MNQGGGFGRAATEQARVQRAGLESVEMIFDSFHTRRSARRDGSQREPFYLLMRLPWLGA